MAYILPSFSNLLAPGALQVPTGPLAIDWTNRVTNKLIGAYVPGVMRGVDITGNGPTLTSGSATSLNITPDGPALTEKPNDGTYSNTLASTVTGPYLSWTEFSFLWRGLITGTVALTPNGSIAGIAYGSGSSSPYTVACTSSSADSSWSSFALIWNTAGTLRSTAGVDLTGRVGFMVTIIGTYKVGTTGPVVMYVDGTARATTVWNSASGPAYAGGDKFGINIPLVGQVRPVPGRATCVYFWNRALTAEEASYLSDYPYSFLISEEMPVLRVPAVAPTLFARSSL